MQQSIVSIFTMTYTEWHFHNDIKNEIFELRKIYNKLGADLAVSKSVNEIMRKQIVMLGRKSCSNEQYSRRDFWFAIKYRG